MVKHGTINGYCNHRCRCDLCRGAWRDYARRRQGLPLTDDGRDPHFEDLLHELCPDGLTDDCPARREHATPA